MSAWLAALVKLHTATPAVLVTVAAVKGSAPREAGTRMVFTADSQFDTIGGGHLEWRAAQIARAMLDAGSAQRRTLQRIALGPSLGQCCGGVVLLAFEWIDADDAPMLAALERCERNGIDAWREVPLAGAGAVTVTEGGGPAPLDGAAETHVAEDADGARWLLDLCRVRRPHLVLFGAGHVGAALVRVLVTLPCRVTWVDEREDLFPPDLPPLVSIEATDVPSAVVDLAEPGAYFLVTTHSHALDQQLSERILRRDDAAWFGLIGSATKRKQFEHRLLERGIGADRLDRMTCPIGIAGIRGKEPASIAIAVAAQLVQLWEAAAAQERRPAQPAATSTN